MIHRAKTVNPFWSKIDEKKLQSSLNPFAKEHRDLNFWQVGVIFRGEFDGDAQNAPAFPKPGNHGSITEILGKDLDKIFGAIRHGTQDFWGFFHFGRTGSLSASPSKSL